MNSHELDELLRDYSKQPLPPPPERLVAGVWRDIEARRHRRWWTKLFPVLSWRELFAEPRLAAAGLAVALVAGVLPVVAMRGASTDAQLARTSLHFDVFSARSPGMPATLLATSLPTTLTNRHP